MRVKALLESMSIPPKLSGKHSKRGGVQRGNIQTILERMIILHVEQG